MVRDSIDWSPVLSVSPLLGFLAKGNKGGRRRKPVRWLRQQEVAKLAIDLNVNGNEKKQLDELKNTRLVEIEFEMVSVRLRFGGIYPQRLTAIADVVRAYSLSVRKIKRCVKAYPDNGFSSKREKGKNVGLTVFNSEQKINKVFILLHYYKKLKRMQEEKPSMCKQLAEGFSKLNAMTLQQCEAGARTLRRITVNIGREI
jgi:hypothetical protein